MSYLMSLKLSIYTIMITYLVTLLTQNNKILSIKNILITRENKSGWLLRRKLKLRKIQEWLMMIKWKKAGSRSKMELIKGCQTK